MCELENLITVIFRTCFRDFVTSGMAFLSHVGENSHYEYTEVWTKGDITKFYYFHCFKSLFL